jgi:hypothetical protein
MRRSSNRGLTAIPAGAIDQNPPHGLCSGRKEVASAVPSPDLFTIDETEIGLVDEGRGV